MALSTGKRALLIAIAASAVALFLFIAVWYMMASQMPGPIQGIVMVTAAILIAFGMGRIFLGRKDLFGMMSRPGNYSGGLSTRMSALVLFLFVATVLILPPFLLWLSGAR